MKFFVTYQMPHTAMDEWMKLPEAEQKAGEKKMQSDWNTWIADHKDVITETAGVSKPKRISANGVEDARNDIMMYSMMEAESLEAAAEMFKNHPHFDISGGWIEVMSINKEMK